MKVLKEKKIVPEYIVLKLDNLTFSARLQNLELSRQQETDTQGVGIQDNVWIKGKFTEFNNHVKLKALPFELNVYLKKNELGG